MSTISFAELENYTARINKLSFATRKAIARMMANLEYDSVEDLRVKLMEMFDPFLGAATDDSAAYSADFYDSVREQAIGAPLGALADSMRNPDATDGFIRAIIQKIVEGKALEGILEELLIRADYEIKRAAGDCIMQNSLRDPQSTGYARIPTGAETCDFCLMLASRGFVYATEKTAGSEGHYHANCDCRIVPGFSGMKVEGYDPDDLYRKWKDAQIAKDV